MKKQIIDYYLSEKQWSTYGLWIAIAVVLLSVVLWKTASAHGMQRGVSYALSAGGLLFMVAAGLTIGYNNQRISKAEQMPGKNDLVLQQQEITRMENVMKNAYETGLISFSIALLTGFVLLFIFKTPVGKGIALGVLLFGAYGLMMEALSMRQNGAYLQQIKTYRVSLKQ